MRKNTFQKYCQRVQTALEDRHKFEKPHSIILAILVCAAVFIFLCLSVYMVPEGDRYSFHFYLESGAVTILSTTILIMASFFSLASLPTVPSEEKRLRIFFLIVTLALIYLVLDEVFLIHEHIGERLDQTGFLKIIFRETAIRRWNDLIIILYGVAALPILAYFFPTAIRLPYVGEYFLIAFLCYCAHTAVDSVVEPPTTPSYIIEESFKVFASTFLALGTFAGWQNVQDIQSNMYAFHAPKSPKGTIGDN